MAFKVKYIKIENKNTSKIQNNIKLLCQNLWIAVVHKLYWYFLQKKTKPDNNQYNNMKKTNQPKLNLKKGILLVYNKKIKDDTHKKSGKIQFLKKFQKILKIEFKLFFLKK